MQYQYQAHRSVATRLVALAMASVLSACGGGGISPAQTASVKAPEPTLTPTPTPVQSPTMAQPLALAPQVALGDVMINGGPGVRRVSDDRYASVGKLVLDASGRLAADGKALQVIQALTSPDTKLAVLSDPNDRSRYLVLLHMADVNSPGQTAKYLCAAGTWTSAELSQFVGMDELYAAPCKGEVQFLDSSIRSNVIINGLSVAHRLSSEPAATVTAYLDTTPGQVDFETYYREDHLFQELNRIPLGTLLVDSLRTDLISTGYLTFRKALNNEFEQDVEYYPLSDGVGMLEVNSVYAEESIGPVVSVLTNSAKPEQFILFMQPSGTVTMACRSANMSEEQATDFATTTTLAGLPGIAMAGPLDVCNDATFDPLTRRLRLKDTVLNQRGRLKGTIRGKVLVSATISANINTRPSF